MPFLSGVMLLALTPTTAWVVRPRNGDVIPPLEDEARQFAIAMALMLMLFASLALMAGLTSVAWR
jgi:aminoglycoside phosphotransferase (APT) family kinase protein